MTFDQSIRLASEIIAQGRRLDAIRFLRRHGLTFQTARKYADEIANGAPWMKRAGPSRSL